MTNEEIKEIIEKHQHWLKEDCEGWENMKADLRGADLRGAVDADMRERRLKRELWLTRGAVHKANRKAMYSLLQAYPLWEGSPAGLEVHKNIHRYDGYERKCLAKAEEYK